MKLIELTQGQSAIVDDEMYEILNRVRWFAHYAPKSKTFYVRRGFTIAPKRPSTDFLHWWVIGRPLGRLTVDHINRNPLDNRRENLRIVTYRENLLNRREFRTKSKTGMCRGTTLHKKSGKWHAQLYVNGKSKYVGSFNSELEAHEAYLMAKEGLNG